MDNQPFGGNFVSNSEGNPEVQGIFSAEVKKTPENLREVRQNLGEMVNSPELFETKTSSDIDRVEVGEGMNLGVADGMAKIGQEQMLEMQNLAADGSTEGIKGANLNGDVMSAKDYEQDRHEADTVLKEKGLYGLKNWDMTKMKKTLKYSWNRDFPGEGI